ncbi:hypothetical protein TVAG_233180 [Trichomonas vaginalis G3]|uniref:Transcription and mRNA export factor ENY2 n=1 Tax=Trichomonas vaginalis (strain ATCC PRA-98 / G3) TaxID=412133 RepID=A2ERY7_TRIV3|nr:transcription factor e(y)2 family [Trichomonas vaginalis G3]EAY04582.1 hypothetical protein TVAG_233180 [Trichomonas vaginalis G3]KAI5516081.1 transcription factor e(y)2 family [Trichomonas vaginalis G3]|eukprot:XP_001316805.1 hypothetical protein [Trichomonas vaginalis G3]
MSQIEWESLSESEIKAEAEAILESSGQSKKIRAEINEDPSIIEWKENIRKMIEEIAATQDITKLNPDKIYDMIADQARQKIPQEIIEKVEQKILTFIEKGIEDRFN